jgi:tRNA (mo5U34)-methyltransferase
MDQQALQAKIAMQPFWYHQIELAPGVRTPGVQESAKVLRILDDLGLPADCSGLRVLDIGIRDGFYSFEMERRKAAEVVGIDYVPPTQTGFQVAAEVLNSKVKYVQENIYNLTPEKHGTFDIVLFLGVIYHLRNPMLAMDILRSVIKPGGILFIECVIIDEKLERAFQPLQRPRGNLLRRIARKIGHWADPIESIQPIAWKSMPLWEFYPRGAMVNDFTTVWGPSIAGLRAMAEQASFQPMGDKIWNNRGHMSAKAIEDSKMELYRKLDTVSDATGYA